LRHLKWNKERLIEAYMDNPSKVLVDAGVALTESHSQPQAAPIRTQSSSSSGSNSRRPTRSSSKLVPSRSSRSSPTSPTTSYSIPKPLKASKSIQHFLCPICFDDDPALRTLSLDCEHTYCSGCWTAYVVSKVRDEGEHCIRCMEEKCQLVAPDNFIQSILVPEPGAPVGDPTEEAENAKVWARFQELLIRYFVSCNRDLKFCPYPSCTNTVSCPSASSKLSLTSVVPIVSCGARGIGGQDEQLSQSQGRLGALQGKEHKFCFGCPIEADHRPVICAVAKMWMKKCRDDSETANWIKSNTKECTNCQSTIEKNGGCK
jgi:ariadne-1